MVLNKEIYLTLQSGQVCRCCTTPAVMLTKFRALAIRLHLWLTTGLLLWAYSHPTQPSPLDPSSTQLGPHRSWACFLPHWVPHLWTPPLASLQLPFLKITFGKENWLICIQPSYPEGHDDILEVDAILGVAEVSLWHSRVDWPQSHNCYLSAFLFLHGIKC